MDAAGGVLTLESLACSVGLSPRYFHGVFKAVMGLTPNAYAMKVRKEKSNRNALPSQARNETCVRNDGPPASNGNEDDRRTLPCKSFGWYSRVAFR
jgi:methylphosphotriester-DNA--protein-cysteine methyltransferase